MNQRICIIGTGLIGCSFALALKQAGFNGHITGSARKQATLDEALALGMIDSGFTDAAKAVKNADLVMLTVPMLAVDAVLQQIAPMLASHTVITDGGSVKGSFVDSVRKYLPNLANVVPGHPIAGRERSGAAAAKADLFQQKRVLLTPLHESTDAAVELVSGLWKMTGAHVETLEVQTHDRVLAATSHLPHVLAFGLVDMLATQQEHEEIFRYAAGGFGDFTRIASGDSIMWRDICLTNGVEVSSALANLLTNLERLKHYIDSADGEALEHVFKRAKDARDAHTANSLSACDTGPKKV